MSVFEIIGTEVIQEGVITASDKDRCWYGNGRVHFTASGKSLKSVSHRVWLLGVRLFGVRLFGGSTVFIIYHAYYWFQSQKVDNKFTVDSGDDRNFDNSNDCKCSTASSRNLQDDSEACEAVIQVVSVR